jgi:hypothetical protein
LGVEAGEMVEDRQCGVYQYKFCYDVAKLDIAEVIDEFDNAQASLVVRLLL